MRPAAIPWLAPVLAGVIPGQVGLVHSEFVFETAPTRRCHASTLVATDEGLVAAWFGGEHEKHPGVGIWVARQHEGRWTAPVEVANGIQYVDGKGGVQRHPCWNPVLFQPQVGGRPGPLLLFYKCGPDPKTWWGMLAISSDGGRTFGVPRRLPERIDGPVKNKPIQLAGGDILCGSSTEHDGWRVHFERTADLGRTWRRIGPVAAGGGAGKAGMIQAIQPSILTYRDGRMQALCRSSTGFVVETWSKDGGATWSELRPTALPNPNSGTDAVTLADGRQLLVYNHTQRRGPFPSGRNMLNVAVSSDGASWSAALVLERDQGEYSYPAVIQTRDGKVHITYTWRRERIRHVVLDPARLRLQPITESRWPG